MEISKILKNESEIIIRESIKKVLPDEAVKKALTGETYAENTVSENTIPENIVSKRMSKIILVSVGKAAWQMANAANEICGDIITEGIVITKHGYSQGTIISGNAEKQSEKQSEKQPEKQSEKQSEKILIREAGHPVPDNDTFSATKEALKMTENLTENDIVIFLLSGGGSSLFEEPQVEPEILQDITNQLLASGADITEINTIRKRLSKVKGGRFAIHCAPAKVFTVILSDIIGDPIDMIASGPAYPDSSTCSMANEIVRKYNLKLDESAWKCLEKETPKQLDNVETVITGSVRQLCQAAADECEKLGYKAEILTDTLCCEAKDAGEWLSKLAKNMFFETPGITETVGTTENQEITESQKTTETTKEKNNLNKDEERNRSKIALIAGGETVVKLTGKGLGGRNQEIALSAAANIEGLKGIAIFSVGSDGTDGPTDAAGGYVDFETAGKLRKLGIDIDEVLENNDSYHALEKVGGLIKTGPTGTNVNDVAVVLINRM